MNNFDDIRPYHDEEVRPTLARVLADPDFRTAMARLSFPRLSKYIPGLLAPLIVWYLNKQLKDVNSVLDLQMVVQSYMAKMMDRTMQGLTYSGLEKIAKDKPYFFVSNHRDIALDPAFIDWALHNSGHHTARLAIGDNLLTMPYASDLMRLNKSFIVKRSAKGNKEKFNALKHLSAYLHHSITVDRSNLWIAQRQGRAKDGLDRTESAVIKMFSMNKPKTQSFSDYIRELHIVPVSISYEWDPLDEHKARELYAQQHEGSYQKGQHEDVVNIARGIDGMKGRVHLAFGDEMNGEYEDADAFAEALDQQIIANYVLQPSNCFAYRAVYGRVPAVTVGRDHVPFEEKQFKAEAVQFNDRLRAMDPKYRNLVRNMYANPVLSQLEQQGISNDSALQQQKMA